MNYDRIAEKKVNELRSDVRSILVEYNNLTGSKVTRKEVRSAPKSRLLYILCRYWVEIDAIVKYGRMKEELEHREELVKDTALKQVERAVNPPIVFSPGSVNSYGGGKRTYTVTVEEVVVEEHVSPEEVVDDQR